MTTATATARVGPAAVTVVSTATAGPPGTAGPHNHPESDVTGLVADLGAEAAARAAADAALDTAKVAKAGDTMTGPLTLPADPTLPLQAATRQYVLAVRDALVAAAPGLLDTLKELADAIGDDPNFAATMTAALAGKQPLDAELTALAALVSAANKLPYFTGSGAAALTDLSAFIRTLLDDADAATARATLGLIIGTNVQAWDADLDTLAAGGAGATTFLRALLDGTYAALAADVTAHYVSGAWRIPSGPHPWQWLVPSGGPWPTAADGLAASDKVIDDLLSDQHGSATRAETSRSSGVASTMASGTGFGALFVPERNMTVTKLWCIATNTVSAVLTVCKLGLFTVDGSGNITLVARTAHDTGLVVANTDKSSPLATAGGFPASYDLLRGSTYALMFLPVFASGSLAMRGDHHPFNTNPMTGFTVAGLADLPTGTTAVGSLTRAAGLLWMAAEA